MMNYEKFKEKLKTDLIGYMPMAYQDWNLAFREVPKVNGYLEGIHLMPECGCGATPTLYVDDLYRYYQKCGSMEKACQKAAALFVMGVDYALYVKEHAWLDLPKDKIVFCLINAEENRRLLEEVPHRMTLDLALIYRIMLREEDDGFNSTIITNELAEEMGLSEEELYELAMENTPKILPAECHNHENVFGILTNAFRLMGATTMVYPNLLKNIAEKMETDLFILPSSIHEVFVIPSIGQDVADLNRTIVEANNTIIKREELLSHHVYFYDRDRDVVEIPLEMISDDEE